MAQTDLFLSAQGSFCFLSSGDIISRIEPHTDSKHLQVAYACVAHRISNRGGGLSMPGGRVKMTMTSTCTSP